MQEIVSFTSMLSVSIKVNKRPCMKSGGRTSLLHPLTLGVRWTAYFRGLWKLQRRINYEITNLQFKAHTFKIYLYTLQVAEL